MRGIYRLKSTRGSLTKLEIKTLYLLALGHTPEQIARRYKVLPGAIHSRVKRASDKMNTPTMVATVILAHKLGYFKLPEVGEQGWVERDSSDF